METIIKIAIIEIINAIDHNLTSLNEVIHSTVTVITLIQQTRKIKAMPQNKNEEPL